MTRSIPPFTVTLEGCCEDFDRSLKTIQTTKVKGPLYTFHSFLSKSFFAGVQAVSESSHVGAIEPLNKLGNLLVKEEQFKQLFLTQPVAYTDAFRAFQKLALLFVLPSLYAAWNDIGKDSSKAKLYFPNSTVDGRQKAVDVARRWQLVLRSLNDRIMDGTKQLRSAKRMGEFSETFSVASVIVELYADSMQCIAEDHIAYLDNILDPDTNLSMNLSEFILTLSRMSKEVKGRPPRPESLGILIGRTQLPSCTLDMMEAAFRFHKNIERKAERRQSYAELFRSTGLSHTAVEEFAQKFMAVRSRSLDKLLFNFLSRLVQEDGDAAQLVEVEGIFFGPNKETLELAGTSNAGVHEMWLARRAIELKYRLPDRYFARLVLRMSNIETFHCSFRNNEFVLMLLLSESSELEKQLERKVDNTVAIKLCGKAAFDEVQTVLSERGVPVAVSSWDVLDEDGAPRGMQLSSSGRPKGALEDCLMTKALNRYHSTASSTAAVTASLRGSAQGSDDEDEDVSQRATSSPARFTDCFEGKDAKMPSSTKNAVTESEAKVLSNTDVESPTVPEGEKDESTGGEKGEAKGEAIHPLASREVAYVVVETKAEEISNSLELPGQSRGRDRTTYRSPKKKPGKIKSAKKPITSKAVHDGKVDTAIAKRETCEDLSSDYSVQDITSPPTSPLAKKELSRPKAVPLALSKEPKRNLQSGLEHSDLLQPELELQGNAVVDSEASKHNQEPSSKFHIVNKSEMTPKKRAPKGDDNSRGRTAKGKGDTGTLDTSRVAMQHTLVSQKAHKSQDNPGTRRRQKMLTKSDAQNDTMAANNIARAGDINRKRESARQKGKVAPSYVEEREDAFDDEDSSTEDEATTRTERKEVNASEPSKPAQISVAAEGSKCRSSPQKPATASWMGTRTAKSIEKRNEDHVALEELKSMADVTPIVKKPVKPKQATSPKDAQGSERYVRDLGYKRSTDADEADSARKVEIRSRKVKVNTRAPNKEAETCLAEERNGFCRVDNSGVNEQVSDPNSKIICGISSLHSMKDEAFQRSGEGEISIVPMDVDKDSSIKRTDDRKHQKPTDRTFIAEKAERPEQFANSSNSQIEGHPHENEIVTVMEVDGVNAGLDDNFVFEEDCYLQKPKDDMFPAGQSERIAVERFKTDEKSGNSQDNSRKRGQPGTSPYQPSAQNEEEERIPISEKSRTSPLKPTPHAVKSLNREVPKSHKKAKELTKTDQRQDTEQVTPPGWPEATQARTVVQGPVTQDKQARNPRVDQEERRRTSSSLWLPSSSGSAIPFPSQTAALANGRNITIEEAGRSFSESLIPLLKSAIVGWKRSNGENDADDGGISRCKRKRDPKGDVPRVNEGERLEQRNNEGGIKEQIVDIGSELMRGFAESICSEDKEGRSRLEKAIRTWWKTLSQQIQAHVVNGLVFIPGKRQQKHDFVDKVEVAIRINEEVQEQTSSLTALANFNYSNIKEAEDWLPRSLF